MVTWFIQYFQHIDPNILSILSPIIGLISIFASLSNVYTCTYCPVLSKLLKMQILGSLLPICCPFLCSGISPQKIQKDPSGFHSGPLQINSTHITPDIVYDLVYIYPSFQQSKWNIQSIVNSRVILSMLLHQPWAKSLIFQSHCAVSSIWEWLCIP